LFENHTQNAKKALIEKKTHHIDILEGILPWAAPGLGA